VKITVRGFESWLLQQKPNSIVGNVRDNQDCPIYRWLAPKHNEIEHVTIAQVRGKKPKTGVQYVMAELPTQLVEWWHEINHFLDFDIDGSFDCNVTREQALACLYRVMLRQAGLL